MININQSQSVEVGARDLTQNHPAHASTGQLYSRWIPHSSISADSRVRLFCFPYAGGGASTYHRWAQHLNADLSLFPVKMPGREDRFREAPYTDLGKLVKDFAEETADKIRPPLALYGHSMGALIVFELARFLRREHDLSPVCLFVGACAAPQLRPRMTKIGELPDEQFLAKLRERYGGFGTESANDEQLMQLLLPTLRADITLVESYQYIDEAPLACPVMALGGSDDKGVSPADLAAWQQQTTAAFSHCTIPGDHFFLDQSRRATAQAIRRRLRSLLPTNTEVG